MIPIEKIKINLQTIEHIDKIIELRTQQIVELNKLKHSMIIQLRALNPVFWLEGKKISELKILSLKEDMLRIECGLKPNNTGLKLSKTDFIKHLYVWVKIEKLKWKKNRMAILLGKEEMIV